MKHTLKQLKIQSGMKNCIVEAVLLKKYSYLLNGYHLFSLKIELHIQF